MKLDHFYPIHQIESNQMNHFQNIGISRTSKFTHPKEDELILIKQIEFDIIDTNMIICLINPKFPLNLGQLIKLQIKSKIKCTVLRCKVIEENRFTHL